MKLLSQFFRSPERRIFCDPASVSAIKAFRLEGLDLVDDPSEAELLWMRKGYRSQTGKLEPHQLINHYLGETGIINKGKLTGTLREFDSRGISGQLPISEFYPETYRLFVPSERAEFFDQLPAQDDRDNLWIYKPGNESRGRGIRIMWEFDELRKEYAEWGDKPIREKSKQGIIQRYIKNPLLLDGRKSEIRVYWLVLNLDPLMVLVYPECTVRLNSLPFKLDDFDNQLVHVTNVYQQKNHPDYDPDLVLKWPFERLGSYIHEELGIGAADYLDAQLRPRIREILSSVAHAGREKLGNEYPEQGDCFAVFGADMIIDDQLRPWLSEVQKGPGLSFSDSVKRKVIPPMLGEAARIALEVRERRLKGKPLANLKSVQGYDWVVNELQPDLVTHPPEGYFSPRCDQRPASV